jgi:hypothetical protein
MKWYLLKQKLKEKSIMFYIKIKKVLGIHPIESC